MEKHSRKPTVAVPLALDLSGVAATAMERPWGFFGGLTADVDSTFDLGARPSLEEFCQRLVLRTLNIAVSARILGRLPRAEEQVVLAALPPAGVRPGCWALQLLHYGQEAGYL